MKAVTRLFDTEDQANAAIGELEASGLEHGQLGLVSPQKVLLKHAPHSEAADGVVQGAAVGALTGAGAGLITSLGFLVVPGLGPVFAAGWLAFTAVGAVMGVAAGAAACGILGLMADAGHSEEEARIYAEGVRRGGYLLSAKPHNADQARLAEGVMIRHGGADAAQRAVVYAEEGWTGGVIDPDHAVAEARSFEGYEVITDHAKDTIGPAGGFGTSVTSL
ncbi:MAG: hypothetical protein JWM33_409 [Caulobacteraceae bacterium]|nr:hypothetical protein [Caulobacteraceae bacterium]